MDHRILGMNCQNGSLRMYVERVGELNKDSCLKKIAPILQNILKPNGFYLEAGTCITLEDQQNTLTIVISSVQKKTLEKNGAMSLGEQCHV